MSLKWLACMASMKYNPTGVVNCNSVGRSITDYNSLYLAVSQLLIEAFALPAFSPFSDDYLAR